MTRLEKDIEKELGTYSNALTQKMAKSAADVAMKYIIKAFEAGRESVISSSAPDLRQWLEEQKL